jgi:mRNA interferase MazF
MGHEQDGRRPVVVLSPGFYNKRSGMLVACPITSRAKGYPFEVPIPEGLAVAGVALADHLRSLDWSARPIQRMGTLPDDLVEEILARSRTLLS